MSSTNKTDYLGLNQWLGTDRPTRIDYVQDNEKIDTAVKNHITNENCHVTSEEKLKLSNPTTTYYSGNGGTSRTITLAFVPSVVFVFKKNASPVGYSSSYPIVNSAMGITSNGYSAGITINGTVITVKQSTAVENDGSFYNLNQSGGQYGIIAFK